MRNTRRDTIRASGLLGTLLLAGAVRAADPAGSGPERPWSTRRRCLATHTIYRPADLKGRYPVVLWGNGSCVNSSFGYREFLAEIASHGFIVLAIGPYRDSPAPRQPRTGGPGPVAAVRDQLQADARCTGLDHRREPRPGSPFNGKVVVDKVAAMGHSCGGLQTVKVSTDPRITTAVVLNSGMMTDDDQYMIRHELKRSVLDQMHAPIAYFIGGETDIAYANSETDWKELQQRKIPAAECADGCRPWCDLQPAERRPVRDRATGLAAMATQGRRKGARHVRRRELRFLQRRPVAPAQAHAEVGPMAQPSPLLSGTRARLRPSAGNAISCVANPWLNTGRFLSSKSRDEARRRGPSPSSRALFRNDR